MSDKFENAMKKLAEQWANSGGTHSHEVVSDVFSVILEHFPDWTSKDRETQDFIKYIKS